MNGELHGWDPELGEIVAIPEPFWVRTFRTLLRWRPACYSCRETFRTREQWERHWLNEHRAVASGPEGSDHG